MLFFLHIPKTAGSTLNYIIKNNYKEKAQEIRWHWTTWLKKEDLVARVQRTNLTDKSLVHGHFVFGFHDLVDSKEIKYLTFVRDPLKKVISGFYHVQRDRKSQFHDVYRSKRLEDYLLDENILENDNGLVRRLSGIGDQLPYGKIEAKHLEMAIQNINRHFVAVGITEQFDLSVEWLKRIGVFKNVYYWKQNEGSNNGKRREIKIAENVQQKFMALNAFDFQLYEYCVEQFNKNTNSIPFSQSGFDRKNKLYNISLIPSKIVKKVSKLFR